MAGVWLLLWVLLVSMGMAAAAAVGTARSYIAGCRAANLNAPRTSPAGSTVHAGCIFPCPSHRWRTPPLCPLLPLAGTTASLPLCSIAARGTIGECLPAGDETVFAGGSVPRRVPLTSALWCAFISQRRRRLRAVPPASLSFRPPSYLHPCPSASSYPQRCVPYDEQ